MKTAAEVADLLRDWLGSLEDDDIEFVDKIHGLLSASDGREQVKKILKDEYSYNEYGIIEIDDFVDDLFESRKPGMNTESLVSQVLEGKDPKVLLHQDSLPQGAVGPTGPQAAVGPIGVTGPLVGESIEIAPWVDGTGFTILDASSYQSGTDGLRRDLLALFLKYGISPEMTEDGSNLDVMDNGRGLESEEFSIEFVDWCDDRDIYIQDI